MYHDGMEMRCRKCGYDLRGLDEHRCPECATDFDPEDSDSYLKSPESGRRRALHVVIGVILFAIPVVVMTDATIEAVPDSLRFILWISPVIIVGGLTLAGTAAMRSYQALAGKYPWIDHRAGFWFALIVGGLLYVAFIFSAIYRFP